MIIKTVLVDNTIVTNAIPTDNHTPHIYAALKI